MYGTAAGFLTYHTARNRDVSAYESGEVEAALLVASEWLDGRYRSAFAGYKVGLRDQVREWPRAGGVDINGFNISSETIPTEVENATYEAALRQLQSAGSLSLDYTPSKYNRVAVSGAVSVEYNSTLGASDVQTQLQIVAEIIAPVLTGSDNVSSLSGSISRT